MEALINFLCLLVTISSGADRVDLWSFLDLCDLCAPFKQTVILTALVNTRVYH